MPNGEPDPQDSVPLEQHEVEYVVTQSPILYGYIVYNDAAGDSVDQYFSTATWSLSFAAEPGTKLSLRFAAYPDADGTITVAISVDGLSVASDSATGTGPDITVAYDL